MVMEDDTLFKVDPFQLRVRPVNVLGERVLGVLGHLADGALIGDARHHVALLGVAPHALLAAYELAARPAHEPAGRRHDVVLHEGADVARREGPRLADPGGLHRRCCKIFRFHYAACRPHIKLKKVG